MQCDFWTIAWISFSTSIQWPSHNLIYQYVTPLCITWSVSCQELKREQNLIYHDRTEEDRLEERRSTQGTCEHVRSWQQRIHMAHGINCKERQAPGSLDITIHYEQKLSQAKSWHQTGLESREYTTYTCYEPGDWTTSLHAGISSYYRYNLVIIEQKKTIIYNIVRLPTIDINKPPRLTCPANAVKESEPLSHMHWAVNNCNVQNCL